MIRADRGLMAAPVVAAIDQDGAPPAVRICPKVIFWQWLLTARSKRGQCPQANGPIG